MTTTNNSRIKNKRSSHARAAAPSLRATRNAAIFISTAAILISLFSLPARAANEGSQARAVPAIDIKRATQSIPVSATASPVLDIEFASSVVPLSSTATVLASSTSSAFFATAPLATAPPAVSPAATGTSSPATSTQSASAPATSTATPSLYQQFYEETFKKCMASTISEDIMDYLIKHFDVVQDGFQNETIERTIGCLALEREDEKVCDKFNMLPENSKKTFPYETHIASCKDKLATFKVMKDAFAGKDCKNKMEAYCAQTGVCKRPGGDGKICTCPLYAVLKCDIPTCNTIEQCNGLKPKVEAVLAGQSAAVIDKHSQAVIALCQKAVLGMNPMENERDIGSSVSLFFGGLYSGATWPVFSKDANPEKFGLPQEYAYWYDYVRKHNVSCLKHLDIFRENFCSPYAKSTAREKEEEALKKQKEEKDAKKNTQPEKATGSTGETKKENK